MRVWQGPFDAKHPELTEIRWLLSGKVAHRFRVLRISPTISLIRQPTYLPARIMSADRRWTRLGT